MRQRAPQPVERRHRPESGAPPPSSHSGSQADAREALFERALAEPTHRVAAVAELAPKFGLDAVDLKVRTGGPVVAAALDALRADAAAIGNDLLFRSAAPGRDEVAHELTHVAQAANGAASSGTTSRPGDAAEREAEEQSARVLDGETADVQAAPGGETQGGFWSSLASIAAAPIVAPVKAVASLVSATSSALSWIDTTAQAAGDSTRQYLDEKILGAEPVVESIYPGAPAGTDTLSEASSAEPSSVNWSYVNGVDTPEAAQDTDGSVSGAKIDAVSLSNLSGETFDLNYNPTKNLPVDLGECAAEKFMQHDSPSVVRAADEYVNGILSGETQAIVAHSQGAIETKRALENTQAQLITYAVEHELEPADAWARDQMNRYVEVLLVGPGQAESTFGAVLDLENVDSITDSTDLISEGATLNTKWDVAEWTLDAGVEVSRWLWDRLPDGGAKDRGFFDEHSFQNYLQEHPEEIQAWIDEVSAEHADAADT